MKRGYHRIRLSDGSYVEGPVIVETDQTGTLLSYRLLDREEEAVEWYGGTYRCEEKDNSNKT